MYDLNIVIAIGAALLILGLVVGALWGRSSSPATQKYKEVERKLDQVLQDKKAYEDDVIEHFSDTARLLNNLTEPALAPIRKIIPPMGGLDITPMLLLVLLQLIKGALV